MDKESTPEDVARFLEDELNIPKEFCLPFVGMIVINCGAAAWCKRGVK